MDQLTTRLVHKALSRRSFMAGAGVATAATLAGCGSTTYSPNQPTAPTGGASAVTDVDVLNFALNLEYLEAEFYLRAVTGAGIPSADQLSGAGTVTAKSGSKVTFNSTFTAQLAAELAQTELQHVRVIQQTIRILGGTPVAAPAIDLLNSFNAVASAAGLGSSFDPYASEANFLIGAGVFEDVGVTAYTGAASLISNATVLSAAAGIQAAEAYHAGTIRTLLVGNAVASGSTTGVDTFNKIVAVRASLGGGNETMLSTGVSSAGVVSNSGSTVVAADSTNAVAFARTVDQVLHIVYAASGTGLAKGGFFPNGLNGNVKTTAS